MLSWQFRLFGKPEVWHHQNQIEDFNTQKTQALFFYLVAEGCEQNRNELARFFWDDFNLISSQNNLRTALYHLNKDFEDCLAVDRQSVCFRMPESAYLDLALVDAVTPEADLQTLLAAADAYRGDFLAGFTTSNPQFEAWKQAKQAYYRQLIINHLMRLAELYEKDQQHQGALDTAQRLLKIDPLNEAAVLLQMRLFAQLGRHERTIQAYRNYQKTLKNQPGAEPAPKIKEYYTHLKVPLPTRVSTPLPYIETKFFGREAEIEQLTHWLTDPTQRWINLAGPSGVGKSRLAIHAAEAAAAHFTDGVRHIDLRGFNAGEEDLSIENASKLALYAMQVRVILGKSYKSQLVEALNHRELLIILDNFEPSDWRLKFVTEIFLAIPTIKLLGITRQPVDLADGAVMRLAGLVYPSREDLPATFDPDFVNRFPSLQLFEDRAQQVRTGFKIDQSNYRQVAHICHAVQGLPLGIEYLANLLRSGTLDEIMRSILGDNSQDPIAPATARMPKVLETVFEYVWANLAPQVKEISLACALIKGSFSMDTFEAVTQASTDWLPTLIEDSLLHISGKGKFSLHYLVQTFLSKKLDQLPGHYSARYSDYYLNWLIKLDHEAESGPYPIDAFRVELANLVQAWELALEHGFYELLDHTCGPLSRAFEHLGLAEAGFTHFEHCAAQLEGLPKQSNAAQLALGSVVLEAARLGLECARVSTAFSLVEKAHQMALALEDPALLAAALQRKAAISLQSGKTEPAIKFAYDGLTQAVKSGDEGLVAAGVIGLGRAYCTNHLYEKARKTYKAAVDQHLVQENSRMMQTQLLGSSQCKKEQGNFKHSLAINRQAQRLNQTFLDVPEEAMLAFIRGGCHKFVGQLLPAADEYQQTLAAFTSLNHPWWQLWARANLGILHLWQGEHDGALVQLRAAETLARDIQLFLPEVLALKARALLAADQTEAARACLQEAAADQDQPSPYITSARIDLALAEEDHETAHNLAVGLLPMINDLYYDCFDDPFAVYLSLYHGLKDHAVQSAREVLAQARGAFTRLLANLPPGVTIKTILAMPHRAALAHIIQDQIV